MSIIRNWKTYYTLEEASTISNKRIKERAKVFAKKVLEKQKENTLVKEENYV